MRPDGSRPNLRRRTRLCRLPLLEDNWRKRNRIETGFLARLASPGEQLLRGQPSAARDLRNDNARPEIPRQPPPSHHPTSAAGAPRRP